MNEIEMRKIVLDVAWQNYGRFYSWGGDDPSGFDCSGFVIEVFKSVGILPRGGDWTAAALWEMWKDKQVEIPNPGDLIFWENSRRHVVHVEIVINRELGIGASGGGSFVRSLEEAIQHNAFIKIRPIKTRAGVRGYINPF